jgi:hypothetical protein
MEDIWGTYFQLIIFIHSYHSSVHVRFGPVLRHLFPCTLDLPLLTSSCMFDFAVAFCILFIDTHFSDVNC